MAQIPEQTTATYGIPQERGFWQIIGDWASDVSSQQVPGSVVILIILVALAPYIFKLITSWFSRGTKQ